MYDEDRFIPAVHPRYRNLYQDLYEPDEKQVPNSSFRFDRRAYRVICMLWADGLFAGC